MAILSAVLAPGCRAGGDGGGLFLRMPHGKVVLAPLAAGGSLVELSLGLSCLGGSGHGTGAAPSACGPEPDGPGTAQPWNGGSRGTAAAAVRRGRSWRDARRAGVGRRSKLAARTSGASKLASRSCRLAYRTGGGSKLALRSGGAAPANAERGGRAAAGGAGGGGASHAGLLGCCIAELLAALWLVAVRPLAPDWPPTAGSLLPKLAFIGAGGAAGSASRGAGEPLAAGAPAVQAGAAGAAAAEGGWLPCCPWFACRDPAMEVSPPLSGGVAAAAGDAAAATGAAGGPTAAKGLRKPSGKRLWLFTCYAQRWERYRGRSEMTAALALRRCTMPAVMLQST